MADAQRQFVLRLSAQGVDGFVGNLREAAKESTAAKAALDQLTRSAPQLATGLDRADQALAASTARFRAANDAAPAVVTGFRNIGSVATNAGFQIQDFAVQVQGGTSALTAFAQQAPQFLGAFGPAGAIAGAALAIGAVAASILLTGDNAKQAAERIEKEFKGVTEGQKALAEAIKFTNDLYLTQAQRAAAAAQAARQATAESLRQRESDTIQRNEGNALDLVKTNTEIARLERLQQQSEALRARQQRAGVLTPAEGEADFTQRLFQLRAQRDGLEADIGRTSRKLDEIQQTQQRLSVAPTQERLDQNKALAEAAERRAEAERIAAAPRADRTRLTAEIEAERKARELNLQGQEREKFIRDEVATAIAKQSASAREGAATLTRSANTAENFAQGLRATVTAAEQGRAAFLTAAAAAEAHKQAANGAKGSEDALAQAILSRNAAQAASKGAETLLNLREQAEAAQRMAEAVAQGPAAERAAQIEERVRGATREMRAFAEATGDPQIAELADKIGAATRETERQNDALQITRTLRTQQADLDLLAKERDLIGATAQERERELAAFRARREIQGRNGTEDEIRQAENLARRMSDIRSENAQLQNSWNDLANVGSQVFDRVGSAITNALVTGQLQWKDFGNVAKAVLSEILQAVLKLAVINPILNSLFGGNRGTLGGALEVMDNGGGGGGGILGMGMQAASLYRQGSSLFGGSGSTSSGGLFSGGIMNRLFGASSLPGGAYDFASLGNIYTGANNSQIATGFGGFDAFMNQPAYGVGISGATGGAIGQLGPGMYGPATPEAVNSFAAANGGMGASIGSVAGGALGVAGGAYGIYSGIQKGGVGGGFQVAGGTAGVGLGLMTAAGYAATIPVYGWIAAAVLAVLGALLPGQKLPNREGTARFDFGTDTTSFQFDPAKFSQQNLDQAQSMVGSVAQLITRVEDLLSFHATQTLAIGVGDRDGLRFDVNGQGATYNRNEPAMKQMMSDMVRVILQQNASVMGEALQTAVNGLDWSNLETALQQITALAAVTDQGKPSEAQNIASRRLDFAGNFQGAIQELQWVRDVYDPQVSTELKSAFGEQRKALDKQWEDMIDHAERLGLATGVLAQKHNDAINALFKATAAAVGNVFTTLEERRLRATGDSNVLGTSLRIFDMNAAKEIADLRAQIEQLGGTAADATYAVEALQAAQGAERDALINQARQQSMAFNTSLTVRGMRAGGQNEQADLAEFDAAAAQEVTTARQQLEAAGTSAAGVMVQLARLENVQAQERLAIQKRYADEAVAAEKQAADQRNGVARGLLEQLAIGDLGGLSGETRYFAGMQSLNAARQALEGSPGDATALAEFARVAQTVLPVVRDFLGTSERYGAIVSEVAGTLRATAPGGDTANLASLLQAQATGTDRMTETLLSTSGVTNDLLSRISADIARLNTQMAAVIARAA